MLESLRPPESEEGNAASMSRSASYSRSVETDSDEFHSAPSAGRNVSVLIDACICVHSEDPLLVSFLFLIHVFALVSINFYSQ